MNVSQLFNTMRLLAPFSISGVVVEKEVCMSWYLQVLKKYAVFSGRARRKEYWYFSLFNFIIGFVLGIIDAVFGLTLVGLLECIVIGYIYKAHKAREYINEVSEFKIGRWWDICIMVITPGILGVSFIWSLITLIQTGYGGYPMWATFVGVGITVGIVVLSFVLMGVRGKEE